MNTLSYKTVSANKTTVNKEWVLVDADGQTLGRLASKVAMLIRGKYKPNYTPHVDCGDNVIVINAEKIKLTGDKWEQKKYISHSGYPGGQKIKTARELMERKPIAMVEKAMLDYFPEVISLRFIPPDRARAILRRLSQSPSALSAQSVRSRASLTGTP